MELLSLTLFLTLILSNVFTNYLPSKLTYESRDHVQIYVH
jgi:hypothetical protein